MQQLTLARSELWQISRTDQLTGLLNRRGFDAKHDGRNRVARADTLSLAA